MPKSIGANLYNVKRRRSETLKSYIHTGFSWTAKATVILQGLYWITLHIAGYLSPHSEWLLNSAGSNEINSDSSQSYACRPPLPPLTEAVSLTDPIFRHPSKSLDRYLRSRISQPDIDSLSIALVTPSGTIFQKGYGVLKANETDQHKRGLVDENSIYRIASITKMFNVLETLILRDRGALNWDDPITKFFPNFTYNPLRWSKYLSGGKALPLHRQDPITIRQLASHMSGISRDYPPSFDGKQFPTRDKVFEALKEHPLVVPPYSFPVYSNTGFDILGWVNVEADAATGTRSKEPGTFADLLRRDVFQPVGMNSSGFTITPEMAEHIAVAAEENWDTDLDFTDSSNPSGGQYSSLSDISTFMQTLLDPYQENSVISPYTVREWLRPLSGWSDDLTEVGAPWEITKLPDSFGRRLRFYQKGGNLASYHSHFGINPSSSYGIVVLVTGRYANTARLAYEAFKLFQPAFDKLQNLAATDAYVGRWAAAENQTENHATITSSAGSLWITQLVLNNTDILALLQDRKPGKARPFALWNTGPERAGEFRAGIGRPALNDDPIAGCEPYWVSIDSAYLNDAPIDLLYFDGTGSGADRVLKIPGVGVSMTRVSRLVKDI